MATSSSSFPRTPQPALRPARLEVNRTGLWHQVLDFNAGDRNAESAIKDGVKALCSIDRATAFRIVTANALKQPLMYYTDRHGWTAEQKP